MNWITDLEMRAQKLAYMLAKPLSRRAFMRTGVVPSAELRGILAGVRPHTVVDVGANKGQFALLSIVELGAQRVIAFEPLARPAAQFKKALLELKDVTIHEVAVGSKHTTASMNVAKKDDSSSLLEFGTKQLQSYPNTRPVASELVTVVPLANRVDVESFEGPALLKIDVQGFELEVLEGARTIIEAFSWVLIEVSFSELYTGQPLVDDIMRWLLACGFQVKRIGNVTTDVHGTPIQADILFTRNA